MKQTRLLSMLFVILIVALSCPETWSQELKPTATDQQCATIDTLLSFRQWVSCRVDVVVALRINQKGTNKQVEMPSIGTNTTSLVDQTQAPDLFGLGLSLVGLRSGNNSNDDSSFAITTSAYALYAAAAKKDPLDPAVYLSKSGLRSLSFTLGQDTPDDKAETSDRPLLLGFKYLLVNKRDASNQSNRTALRKVSAQLAVATVAANNIQSAVEDFIYNELGPSLGYPQPNETEFDAKLRFILERLNTVDQTKATLRRLSAKQLAEITKLISDKVEPEVQLRQTTSDVFEEIRHRPQLAFSFHTKQRKDGVDEYRSGVLFDVGVYQRLNVAINATFDYADSKIIGADKRGGRLVGEGYFHLTADENIFTGKDPIVMSIAGEAKWLTQTKPVYTGQVKLTIPIFDGVNLPISFSVANRADLIKESRVRGNFGFSFDLAKLLKGVN